jgi:hypothetical protein
VVLEKIDEGIEEAIERATHGAWAVRTEDIAPLVRDIGRTPQGVQVMVGRALRARGWVRVQMSYQGRRGFFYTRPWGEPKPGMVAGASLVTPTATVPAPVKTAADVNEAALARFNRERRANGLPPVDSDEYLRLIGSQ